MTPQLNHLSNLKPSKQIVLSLSSVSGVFLVCIMAAILYVVMSALTDYSRDQNYPKAKQGGLDLSLVDFNKDVSVPLAGEWSFYWNALKTPDEIGKSEASAALVNVPGSWVDSTIDGQPLNSNGFATYTLNIKLKSQHDNLALYVPTIGSAFKLYIDDKLLVSGGTVATGASNSVAQFNPGVYVIEPANKVFTITLQVSSYEYYWSGLWNAPRIGLAKTLHQAEYRHVLTTTFIVGIFFTICLFNLIQFSLRPESLQPLLIAVISFLLGLRELEASQVLTLSKIYSVPFELGLKISFVTFYGMVAPFVAYFYVYLQQEYNKYIVYGVCAISLLMSLLVLLTSASVYSNMVTAYQVFCLLVIVYIAFGVIKGAMRKRENANVLLLGTVMLFCLMVNDILNNMAIIDSVNLVNFGLVAFVMCQNYLTYLYFINASEQNKLLNITLASNNASLEALSGTLEKQVESRTHDLEKANTKLAQLVNEDPLTCLLNRRGLSLHIQRAKNDFDILGKPFCLLLIDFDHFKRLNDTFGHDVGDIVLESGGMLMQSIIKDDGIVGRWGGEEFLVLLQDTELESAVAIAEKLRTSISEKLSEQINSSVSVTIGISQYMQNDTVDNCIKRADQALYQGKQKGRNRVEAG